MGIQARNCCHVEQIALSLWGWEIGKYASILQREHPTHKQGCRLKLRQVFDHFLTNWQCRIKLKLKLNSDSQQKPTRGNFLHIIQHDQETLTF